MVVNSYFSHIAAPHSLRALSRFKYKTFSQKITTIRPVFYWQSLHKFRHFSYYLVNLCDKPTRE